MNDLFNEGEIQKSDITKFCTDKRHRKAYVANNLG